LHLTITAFKLFSVFVLFSASAEHCVYLDIGDGLYSWIMDWSG